MLKLNLLIFLGFLSVALSFSSCVREDDWNPGYGDPYLINGIHDVELKRGLTGTATATLDLDIEYQTSVQERITLSLEDLPEGLYYSFDPSSGYAPFHATLTLVDSGAAPGEYVVKLKSKSTSTGAKTFDIRVTVVSEADCKDHVAKTYWVNDVHGFPFFDSRQKITRVDSASSVFVLNDFMGTGADIYMTADCASSDITIESQAFTYQGNTYEMSGGGRFDVYIGVGLNTEIWLEVTLTNLDTGEAEDCEMHMNE